MRRALAGGPDQLAGQFARVIRGVPDERLEQLLRTPARRLVLDGIFWQMPQHLDRRRATGVRGTIRWRITGRSDGKADTYDLQIADGRCRVRPGGEEDARLTITLDAVEFLKLATGSSNPMRAYFKRRLSLAGDIMLAAKLPTLFRIPARPDPARPASS